MERKLAVSGKMASGKDTVATRALKQLGLEWDRINLADAIRSELQRCYDLADGSPGLVREQLQSWAHNDYERDVADQLMLIISSNTDAYIRTSANRIGLQQLAWLGRQHTPDMWVTRHLERAAAWTQEHGQSGRVLLTTDVREPDEVVTLHTNNFTLIRLLVNIETQQRRLRRRDGLLADHSLTHPNETALDALPNTLTRRFALIVNNDGKMGDTIDQITSMLADRWQL